MCGISGFYQSSSSAASLDRHDLMAMTQALAHRGPDGDGIHLFDRDAGLGHRRLAIIDLQPSAAQPLRLGDSPFHIAFNGEIYNYLEIRKELESKGRRFQTQSDTEVALAAFAEWDVQCFHKFNGMWAMAIYDEARKRLVLSVDRFGVKPLYVFQRNGLLAFASELKAFFPVARKLKLDWDWKGLRTALVTQAGLEAAGKTVFSDIGSLAGGTYMEVLPHSNRVERWWNTATELEETVPETLSKQAERFKELFIDACRIRLRSDVPVATSLSGGLDSSSVVAALALIRDGKPQFPHSAFIHRFQGTALDESHYAEEMVNHAGLEPIWVDADSSEIASNIDEILFGFEAIYPGLPDSAWRIYRAQRERGFKVSLDGHGADEYLAGYHHYVTRALAGSGGDLKRMAGLLRQYREQSGAFFSATGLLKALARGQLSADETAAPVIMGRMLVDPVLKSLRAPFGIIDVYRPRSAMPTSGFDSLTKELYLDFHQRLLPRILRNFDVASMANGVEVRMPFMDYRLVKYVFSLPAESKVGQGYSKLVLREAMKGVLPDSIRMRKLKTGFNSPLQSWLSGPLKQWVVETLSQKSPLDELVDREHLVRFFHQRIIPGHVEWVSLTRFWQLTSAVRWTQMVASVLK